MWNFCYFNFATPISPFLFHHFPAYLDLNLACLFCNFSTSFTCTQKLCRIFCCKTNTLQLIVGAVFVGEWLIFVRQNCIYQHTQKKLRGNWETRRLQLTHNKYNLLVRTWRYLLFLSSTQSEHVKIKITTHSVNE